MADQHLTTIDIEQYVENQIDERSRAAIDQHLAACAACRARATKRQRIDSALRTIPRENPPLDLAARISATIEWRVRQSQQRRESTLLVAVATVFSLLLSIWFGIQVFVAFLENGGLDFLTLFTSHSEISYSPDALLALVEALPITEIMLTLFALVTARVLAASLVDAVRPRTLELGKHP
jgi:predicted anti-sigma-YlaC factor YlaD